MSGLHAVNGTGPGERLWPTLGEAAFHGIAGEVVRTLEPETEADPAGLLLTFLAAVGAAVGPGPHALADGSEHPARLNVVLVGRSSRARKGTSWSVVRRVLDRADPEFFGAHVLGGLASGEGLIAALGGGSDVVASAMDGWLLVQEPEYARLLRVAARPGSTLSSVLREVWDGGSVSVLTRREPLRATGVHVGLVAHITVEELTKSLRAVEIANGMANRFVFALVKRSKRLPSGGRFEEEQLDELGERVGHAIRRGRLLGRLRRSREAEMLWSAIYHSLDDDVDGVVGSLTARAEAQLLRLSVAYAVLDGGCVIEREHLEAAHAVWQFCEMSVRRVFATGTDDAIATRLVLALAEAGPIGLDGTQQRDLFSRHESGARLAAARRQLEERGVVLSRREDTGGRPRIVTRLVGSWSVDTASDATKAGSEGLWSHPSPELSAPSRRSVAAAGDLGIVTERTASVPEPDA